MDAVTYIRVRIHVDSDCMGTCLEGSDTQYSKFLIPKPIRGMGLEAKTGIGYLDPLGWDVLTVKIPNKYMK